MRRSFGEEVNAARGEVRGGEGALGRAVAALLEGTARPPLAFRWGEDTEEGYFGRARRSHSTQREGGRSLHELVYADAQGESECRVELIEYHDFPAVEWVASFTNTGPVCSPPLSEVGALDLAWTCPADAFLFRSPGAAETPRDFQYQREPLQTIRAPRASVHMTAGREGRSSVDWLPFFNLQSGDDGLVIAVGWSGQWFVDIERDGTVAHVRSGMEGLCVSLEPGETIRTPRIALLHWHGRPGDGQNQLRRFLLEHHWPQVDGRPVQAPSCCGSWGGSPTAAHLRQIQRIREEKLPYDCYWIDAGWYGTSSEPCPNVFQGEWWKVGDWRVNRAYHPEGIKPLSDEAHAAGMQFLLWLEPERALHGTPVTCEHPDWFLQADPERPRGDDETLLLDLGNPEARAWVTDLVSGLVTEYGLDWYRQDFNMSPLDFWRANDPPGRQGITELRHVEGLYAFWDELRRRHPGLHIDNCASGGRRLDLETLGRSVPLWRDDYNCFPGMDPEVVQVHGFGLTHWIPLHATSPFNRDPGDTYRFRSVIAPGVCFAMDEIGTCANDEATYPWDWHRKMLEDQRRARPFWTGNLIPLTSCSSAPDAWIALQLHRADMDAGVLLVFRRAASPLAVADFRLEGMSVDADYLFDDADSTDTWTVAGRVLSDRGLRFEMPERRTSRLVFYTRQ